MEKYIGSGAVMDSWSKVIHKVRCLGQGEFRGGQSVLYRVIGGMSETDIVGRPLMTSCPMVDIVGGPLPFCWKNLGRKVRTWP